MPDMKVSVAVYQVAKQIANEGSLDWQAMQDIKNNLCGINCDAVKSFQGESFL